MRVYPKIASLLFLLTLLATAYRAQATPVDPAPDDGARFAYNNTAAYGITASPTGNQYGNLILTWHVEQLSAGYYDYTYTFYNLNKSIDSFYLQTATSFTSANIYGSDPSLISVGNFAPTVTSNKTSLDNFYGVKFDLSSYNTISNYSLNFTTDYAPGYGDFYLKSKDPNTYAFNTGDKATVNTDNPIDYIATMMSPTSSQSHT